MADDEDLKETVKQVLKDKDADAALELLTDDEAYNIGKNERNRLAALAVNGTYVAPSYPKVVGLLSGEVIKKWSEDVGKFGDAETVMEILEDSEHKKQHETIVTAAISNKNIDIVQLYKTVIGSVSYETKDVLNTAIGRNVEVTNEEYAEILGDPGFVQHRPAILRHIEARMDAEDLEEFLEEVRSVVPDDEIVRLEQAVGRKKRYAHE